MPPHDSESTVHLLRELVLHMHLMAADFSGSSGLHTTDIRALILLLDDQRGERSSSPGTLGSRLGLNTASTTALLDRLETRGFVRRERHPTDRRRVVVSVTDHAVAVGRDFFGPTIDRLTTILDGYPRRDADAVARFVGDAVAAVRER
ncbi:MarR family transcriptional regulator [Gordonia sp. TBRC 11910]|uniref:MarR family transcriptional regulator n=1 Tax=Gordonia asplenii TaxID=2725283 RepID=A0A848L072_9ACTN|nr:MarR family transcriptional regulator [Gordonia asplenii]NMO04324.1 MarR family transcriptional regulator [Gordonia asplenii]